MLSLLGGPLGQVYAGHLRRGIALWVVGGLILPILALSSIFLPHVRIGFPLLVLCTLSFLVFVVVDAYLLAKRNRQTTLKGYQRWWVYVLLFVALGIANNAAAYVIRSFVMEAFVIPSRSMSPTIQPGDRILVDKFWCNPKKLRPKDIVVFRSDGPNTPLYVMRLAGLPGDQIEIRDEQVFVNGTKWDDPHAVIDSALPLYPELANYGPTKVPSDSFFVLGDNRRMAKDSRITGPIPFSDLHGKAHLIYWSRERTFPNPHDTSRYTEGPVRWDRINQCLE